MIQCPNCQTEWRDRSTIPVHNCMVPWIQQVKPPLIRERRNRPMTKAEKELQHAIDKAKLAIEKASPDAEHDALVSLLEALGQQ